MDMVFAMEYFIIYFFIFFLFFVFSTFASICVSWLIFINLAFLWHFDTGVRQVLIFPLFTPIFFMSLVFSSTHNLLQPVKLDKYDNNSVNHNIEKLLIHYTHALVFLLDMVNCYTKCEPLMSHIICAQNKLYKKFLPPLLCISNKSTKLYKSKNHTKENLVIHQKLDLSHILGMVKCYTKCEPYMSNVPCAQNKLSKKLLSPVMYTSYKPTMVSKKWQYSICVLYVISERLAHILKKKYDIY